MGLPPVRTATVDDAPTFARLYVAVQAPHFAAHPDIFFPPDPAAVEPAYVRWLADPTWHGFLVHDVTGEPAGFALAHVIRFPENGFVRDRSYLRLDQMAVAPEHEGTGCGTALVRAVLRLAEELGEEHVELSVWAFNERAQRLYEREGFEISRLEMGRTVRTGRGKVDSPTLKNLE